MRNKSLVEQRKVIKKNAFIVVFCILMLILFCIVDFGITEKLKRCINMLLKLNIVVTLANLALQIKDYIYKY